MECLTCTGARRLSPTRRIEKPSLTVLALSHSIIPLSSLPSRGRERSIVTIMSGRSSGPWYSLPYRLTLAATDFITSAACRSEQTLPRPQDWSLYLCCLILIPSLILLSSLLNDCFSVGIPGSDNKETGFERLWTRIYTTYWRSGGKKQQEADGKEVRGVNENAHRFPELSEHSRARRVALAPALKQSQVVMSQAQRYKLQNS